MPNSRCIETGAREGVYLGPQLPVTPSRGEPGRTGRSSRSQQWLWGRWPEMELLGGFFQNLYYYAETMGGQK